MKQFQVLDLISAFVENDKNAIDIRFKELLASFDERSRGKCDFEREYKRYKNNSGNLVELTTKLKPFVFESYKPVIMDDLMLTPAIADVVKEIRKEWTYCKELRENGLTNNNRILLVGPPGNGKTSFAIALSAYLGITPYIAITNKLIDSLLGGSEKNVMNLIGNIPKQGLLFIDEFDTVGTSRTDNIASTGRTFNNIANSLLMSLDRLSDDVMFVAATNRKDLLDSAITRRFDIVLSFPNPTDEQKEKYLDQYRGKRGIDIRIDPKKMQKCVSYSDIERLVTQTHKAQVLSLMEG